MSPSLPSPSKLIKTTAATAARLLGSSRSNVDSTELSVEMATPRAPGDTPRAGRTGKRDQALIAAIARRPGLTVAQAAGELNVDPTALYPVIRRLEARKQLVKRGRVLQPVLEAEGPSTSRRLERLWCDHEHWWDRPLTRGPKPKRCPDHR